MPRILHRPLPWIAAAGLVIVVGIAVVLSRAPGVGGPSSSASASSSGSASGPVAVYGSPGSPTASASTTPTGTASSTPSPTASQTVAAIPTAIPVTAAPTARPTSARPPPTGGTAVLVGAGDISTGGPEEDATAALLAAIPGTVFTAGDNAYNDGSQTDYQHFTASWGRFRNRMRPAPGNHDYHLSLHPYYYTYFGAAAGPANLGYYAYTLGAWRIYSLNSEIVSTAETAWLAQDLAAHPTQCIAAYWHHPRFSSGQHGSDSSVAPLWDALYAARAELMINGHDHDYERFAPQTPAGGGSATGIREIVAGTGGAGLRGFGPAIRNSEVRNGTTNGVLKLTLSPGAYAWRFVPIAGQSFTDSGSGTCH